MNLLRVPLVEFPSEYFNLKTNLINKQFSIVNVESEELSQTFHRLKERRETLGNGFEMEERGTLKLLNNLTCPSSCEVKIIFSILGRLKSKLGMFPLIHLKN